MNKLQARKVTCDGRPVRGKAIARYTGVPARKARFCADLIRDKNVVEALEILEFCQRPGSAPHVAKVVKAALASAREFHPEPENLVIGEIIINDAPMMKRIRPASMGRAVRVRKRQSHIFIALTEF